MCKKKNRNDVRNKPINEMTDTEFITNADYLASPYYRAYVTARARAVTEQNKKSGARPANYGYLNGGYYNNGNYNYPAAQQPRTTYTPTPVYNQPSRRPQNTDEDAFNYNIFDEGTPAKGKKEVKKAPANQSRPYQASAGPIPRDRREKKRGFFLFLIALLMLVIILMAAVYFVDVQTVKDYASIYTISAKSSSPVQITMADPIVGMIKCLNLVDLGMQSEYYNRYLVGRVEDNIVMTAISLYAMPIAALLVIFFSVIGFIKALVALFAKRKSDGFYKKIGFGFLSIATFICAAIMLIGGMYSAQVEFSNFPGYLTFDCEAIQMNYGLYAIFGIAVLNFIFSCVAYKKIKKVKS